MTERVLVAYATKHGSTREVAEEIGRELRQQGLDTDVAEARLVRDLAPYDAVVLGSALYAAHWQRDANRFVARHLAALQARPVWLFSTGPLDRSADAGLLPAPPSVALTTGPIGARAHRVFGGRLLADTPGLDPQVLATHPVGDFRDWAAIRAWAQGIAAALAAPAP
ncbi:MAG: flavodoxin domain-containing protein [Chloroflexota bacterium]